MCDTTLDCQLLLQLLIPAVTSTAIFYHHFFFFFRYQLWRVSQCVCTSFEEPYNGGTNLSKF